MIQLDGTGFSLRSRYFSDFLNNKQPVDWLEILADQLIGSFGAPYHKVTEICKDYPCTLHAVSLNIAGTDPLDKKYLQQLKTLTNIINPTYVSDHVCWVAQKHTYFHDLLPFPYHTSFIPHICERINIIQDYLQKPLLLENLSHYVKLEHQITEAELLNQLCKQTGCGILLDINNVYVSSQNLNYNPVAWLEQLNPKYVKQMHLAGHVKTKQRLVDTHSQPIPKPVWQLYEKALNLFGAVPTCLEWDNNLPDWPICQGELQKIKKNLTLTNQLVDILKYNHKKVKQKSLPPQALINFQNEYSTLLLQTKSLSKENGWSVHQNSYRIQRIKALEQVFGALKKLVGQEYWQQLCLRYVLTYRSTNADITSQFSQMIDLLNDSINEKEHPIIDLSKYLLAWYQTFHQADLIAAPIEQLQIALQQQGEQTQFKISPNLNLFSTHHPIEELWAACQPEQTEINSIKLLQHLPLEPTFYMLYQQHEKVHTIRLNKADFDGLQLLKNPITLDKWSNQAEKIQNLDPNVFAQWYALGWLTLI